MGDKREWLGTLERVVNKMVLIGSQNGGERDDADEAIEPFIEDNSATADELIKYFSVYIKGCAANIYMTAFDNEYLIECVEKDTREKFWYIKNDLERMGVNLSEFKEKLSAYFKLPVHGYGTWNALFDVLWEYWSTDSYERVVYMDMSLKSLSIQLSNSIGDIVSRLMQLRNQPRYSMKLPDNVYFACVRNLLKYKFRDIYATLDADDDDSPRSMKTFEEMLFKKYNGGVFFFELMQDSIQLKKLKVPVDVLREGMIKLAESIDPIVREQFKYDNWDSPEVIERIAVFIDEKFRVQYTRLRVLAARCEPAMDFRSEFIRQMTFRSKSWESFCRRLVAVDVEYGENYQSSIDFVERLIVQVKKEGEIEVCEDIGWVGLKEYRLIFRGNKNVYMQINSMDTQGLVYSLYWRGDTAIASAFESERISGQREKVFTFINAPIDATQQMCVYQIKESTNWDELSLDLQTYYTRLMIEVKELLRVNILAK